VTLDVLRQAWPSVIDAIKAKGRVAAIVIGNASVASFDEGVLTLRFPRQGDVKGFAGSRYEDLLKQAINAMFGVNVVVRAVTGGGDAPPTPARRPGPGPGPSAPQAAPAPSGSAAADPVRQAAAPQAGAHPAPPTAPGATGPGAGAVGAVGGAVGGDGEKGHATFGITGVNGVSDLPPLPQGPDDEDYFDSGDEDMSSSTTVNDLTGMALIQRELGAQIIAEYDD
jgi:DNA polymerase-3 subunit gamma/tau